MLANPTPPITPRQALTPSFITEVENCELVTTIYGTRRRRNNGTSREPPAKSRSRVVRKLIEEDVDMSRSTTLRGYETESKGEGTIFKFPYKVKKSEAREEGVKKKLERLKKELLAELKSQAVVPASLRTSSSFITRIQQETIPKTILMRTMIAYDCTRNPIDHVIN